MHGKIVFTSWADVAEFLSEWTQTGQTDVFTVTSEGSRIIMEFEGAK